MFIHLFLSSKANIKFAGFKRVDQQSSEVFSQAIASIMKKCDAHDICISAIVSDNAASLMLTITNNVKHNEFSLKVLIGEEVLICTFAVHTSQLAIKDFMNIVINIIQFNSSHSR